MYSNQYIPILLTVYNNVSMKNVIKRVKEFYTRRNFRFTLDDF